MVDSNRFAEPVTDADGPLLRLCGGEGSPYSQKVLSTLRFRRLPYRWLAMSSPEAADTSNPPGPQLLPKLVFPDGSAMNDSTFIIRELEQRYPIGRTVVPPNGALAFLAALLEDFCDEWLTKAMFHFRWTYDIETASFGIGTMLGFSAGIAAIEKRGMFIAQRQVSRLRDVVGGNEVTGPVIESSFEQLCRVLEAHFHAGHAFLLGSRPSVADFALFGQLHPMVSMDPETSRRVFAASRSVFFWYHSLKDLSGLSLADEAAGWQDPLNLPPTLVAIFREVGRFYAPFMVANAEAIAAGQKEFECKLDGGVVPWKQASFKYQSKCLQWLREHYSSLSSVDKRSVQSALADTGCLEMLHATASAAKL